MEVNIAVTGLSGSGKTSLIACIFEAMRDKMPGYFSLPEAQDFDALDKSYKALKSKSASDFSISFTNNEAENWDYVISLNDKGNNTRFHFQENPSSIKDINIFVAVIDSPLLMNDYDAGVSEAQDIFTEALEDYDGNKLLMIVPVKSEAYTRQDNNKLFSEISSAFSEVIELSRKDYRGRACVAVLPVHTIGGAAFYDFTKGTNGITGENFRRDKNINFKPEYSETVISFAVKFMIHNRQISGDTAIKIANLANIHDERVSILCGHELLEPEASFTSKPVNSPKSERSTSGSFVKIIAALLIGVIVGAGVGYFLGRKNADIITITETVETESPEAENNESSEELEEARASARTAILERNKAQNEAETLRTERTRAMEMANRYKKQLDELAEELEKSKNEAENLRSDLRKAKKGIHIKWPF